MSLPAPYSLISITPAQLDRFTPVNYVKIDSDLVSALSDSEGDHLARSSIAVGAHASSQSVGTIVHPEGGPISYRSCVVSTQNITDAHVSAAGRILDQCEIPSKSAEITVFLYIVGHQVDHYVVDHESKAIIWAAGKAPESFKGAIRAKHEHEYWIHMENFPGPRFSTPEDIRLLKEVLASNAIDVLTSEGSTSPMSVQQIQTHLKSLESFSSSGDVHQTYSVARLWNLLLQSRVINKYGTPEARMDRFISITDNPPAFAGAYAFIAKLMFKRPHAHLGRCSRTWADRIAYTEEWRKFKATNEREWKQVAALACVLVIASLLVSMQRSFFFKIPIHTALLMALTSVASSYYLLDESQNIGDHAADASTYFQEREEILYGVQRIALINSIPQALLVWSFVFFVLSVFLF
ncbi:hypothetical protein RSOLAG22IIIB_05593 [Rhizoctonia solani]|uniref:Uncharacterized protein n=1 Tax=Rhizoctonia solani TaxID=456999 RepID=A0A0K6G7E6_9AGAM|nr:hypothetical protein RSOLAG22IIIB_05593 [Rhizoctonia solani]